MQLASPPARQPDPPGSIRDAAVLERFDARMRVPQLASAVLPLLVAPMPEQWFGVAVSVVAWIVFLVDYVVRTRNTAHYGRTLSGRLDLVVLVLTAPWFLVPGLHSGGYVVLLRWIRLARLLTAAGVPRRLFRRAGRVAVVTVSVVLLGALVCYHAEHPTNPRFATFGNALWWGVVTLTTVGYGDVVPHTATGRWAGVGIMMTGVAVLGVLAGSLASFFGLNARPVAGVVERSPSAPIDPGPAAAASTETVQRLVDEVAALRADLAALSVRLGDRREGRGDAPT